jgi:glycosyltransferase involved in cell wall biosynthesis
MKILHINGTSYGGTANFVFDLHNQLLKNKNIISFVYVPKKRNFKNIIYPKSIFFKIHSLTKILVSKIFNKFFIKSDKTITLSLLNSYEILKIIKQIKPDIINLHWIGNEFMSLREIKSIDIPIVWTLHDMWLFLPFYHYDENFNNPKKKIKKFSIINKFFLQRKKKLKNKQINFITTSNWMNNQLRFSNLFKSNQIKKIPCGINFQEWFPEDNKKSKSLFTLDKNKKIILFISMGGNNPRKGLNLLLDSLNYVQTKYELLIAGDQYPSLSTKIKFKFIDNPKDIYTRRSLYSASDLVVVPSNLEAFGLVALEASACNTPSVVMQNTGLKEVIKHKENGYVSKFNDPKDFANGINWILSEISKDPDKFSNIKNYVKPKFDIKYVSEKYVAIYKKLINDSKIK